MNKITSCLSFFIILFCIIHTEPGFAQSGAAILQGKVSTADGAPASFVNVAVKGIRSTVTKEDGSFIIRNITPGSHIVKVSYIGLAGEEKTISLADGETLVLDFRLRENSQQLNEVIVTASRANHQIPQAGKAGLSPMDLPQSVQVLGAEVIADQQANRLADVMKNVNGVALGANRGSTNENFFARGYSLGANNILKNGVRSSIGGVPEASTLESVEVLKGSAALLYGGVSGGAVVNMITKKPKFNFGGELAMRAGSYGLYKPTGDIYGPISKNVAFRVIATGENAGSYRDSVKAERVYVNPSLLFNLGRKTELIVQGDYLKSDYTPDFGIGTVGNQIVNIGRNKFLNTVWAYNNTNTATTQANLTHQINQDWKLNTVIAYQEYNRNYFSAERPFANTAGIAARNLTRSKSKEFTYNQQINLTGKLNTGAIKHTLLAGADADQSRTTSYGFKYDNNTTAYAYGNINILDPSTYNTRTDMPGTRIVSNTFTPIYRMGAFVQDLVSLTEKFKVLAGLRYTFQKIPRTITYNEETGLTTLSNNSLGRSKTENAFSPKFALIYQPVKSSSLYLSYANNFTTNTGTDVNLAPLDPSIIDQYEAGVKNDLWNGKVSLNLTWYKIKNDNFAQMALFKADGVTPNADATIKEFSGSTISDGFEIDLSGRLAKGLNFLAGYSYNYFRYTKTIAGGVKEGERLVGTTPHTANGTLFYTFNSGNLKGLKLGASGYYTGERTGGYNTVKAPSVARGIPIYLSDFITFDLSAGYSFKNLSLLAKVSNITDELNYYVHENYSVNPIAPRMFVTTAAYKF